MLPVIAIVGRPNVGKSTLFNRLTGTRNALVGAIPGLTRDRQYGEGCLDERHYIIIDTGGLNTEAKGIETLMAKQAWQAVMEADLVIFLVDARAGLTPDDITIAHMLRRRGKKIYLVVNKIDGLDKETALSDFYSLGFTNLYSISAEHGLGVQTLIKEMLSQLPQKEEAPLSDAAKNSIKIAVIGRPNAGKSTLINTILGEERVITSQEPGTTRDSIFIDFIRHNKNYVLIDTAGVRKKSRVKEKIEKFSVIKTLQAINAADVVVVLIDAKENVADQDLWLLGFVLDAGKALVIAVNKWDDVASSDRAYVFQELENRLTFVDFAEVHFISALHNRGIKDIFAAVDRAYRSFSKELKTSELSKILQKLVSAHEPHLVRGRRIKLRYAHAGGKNPPLIIIHGNQVEAISADYRRYLANAFRKELQLVGTPVRISFKQSINPYVRGSR